MRFSIAAVLAFAASTLAQTADFDPIYSPKQDETIAAGSTYTITWDAPAKYADGTISISLIGGPTQPTQQQIANIASGVKNSAKTYTWTVDAALGTEKVYGLVFKLESNPKIFQYSNPFHIKASENKPTGSGTLTLTKSHGTKTIILSTTSTPSSTTVAPTTTATSSSTVIETTSSIKTKHYNTTISATTLVKSTSSESAPTIVVPTTSSPATTTTPVVVPTATAAASAIRAGSITILGVVAAFLAL